MLKIAREHINRDLDDYIRSRRNMGKKPFFGLKISLQNDSKKGKGDKKVTIFEETKKVEEYEDIPQEEVKRVIENAPSIKEEAPRRGLMNKIFKSFSKDDEETGVQERVVIEKETVVREEKLPSQETLEVLRIAGRWLNRLSPEMKKEFKDSPDYAKYKFYLDKMGLSKK